MNQRFRGAWLGALALAFVLGLAAGLPARLVLRLVPPELAARLTAVEGTVWQGRARFALAAAEPASFAWRLVPTSLLLAAPRATLSLEHPVFRLDGTATLHGRSIELSGGTLRASLGPLARVAGLPPGALFGSVEVRDIGATLGADGIRSLVCSGAVNGVTVAGDGAPLALGDLGLSCRDDAAGPTIDVVDRGGPLALQARIGLAPGWRYIVEGTAGARAGAPPTLAQALPLLGRPEGPDQVRFRYAGALAPFSPAR